MNPNANPNPGRPDQPPSPGEHAAARTRIRPLKNRNLLIRTARLGPSMTPMVDVTLVILIFFMASSTIAGHEWFLRTDLPETTATDAADAGYDLPAPVLAAELFVRDARVLVRGLGDEPRPLDAFIAQINAMDEQAASGLILSIAAADDVPYGAVVALHEAATSRSMRVALR